MPDGVDGRERDAVTRPATRTPPPSSARRRLRLLLRPLATVVDAPPGIVVERDVEIVARDGVVLRVNVHRPEAAGRYPVVLCAHPYGKDRVPRRRRRGGFSLPLQYRMLSQGQPFSHSSLTSWEAPDPAFWAAHGYVVVNADLRGWGRSDGIADLLSAQEGDDGHDLVEWAAAQPWSNGRVGMTGVSYLAIVQWRIAATRPPHLCAINPWEGFTDAYRDFAYPGGVRENGFIRLWTLALRTQRRSPVTIRRQQLRRPTRDDWWASRAPELAQVEVPALVCASFSDHNLHSGGSFAGYLGISSPHKWLYTHRGPKWATYYSPQALDVQRRFFDHFVRDGRHDTFDQPSVRLEVRSDAEMITSIRGAEAWPPTDAVERLLYLDAATARLGPEPAPTASEVLVEVPRQRLSFTAELTDVGEIIGPMTLRLLVRLPRTADVNLFAGIRLLRNGRPVAFEGSYGFRTDLVTHGFIRVSGSEVIDGQHDQPVERFVDIVCPPSATAILPGDQLRLDLQGRWFFKTNPLRGQFPARYSPSRRNRLSMITGNQPPSTLLLTTDKKVNVTATFQ